MKKSTSRYLSFTIFALLLLPSLVVADNHLPDAATAGQSARSFGEWIVTFFNSMIFGTDNLGNTLQSNPEAVMTHIFMGIVLFILIWSVFDQFQFFGDYRNHFINLTLSFAVTMLVLIALPVDFSQYLLPSYGAMGATLLTFLPFLIIFWFSIKTRSISMARMVWFIFAFYFLAFYVLSAVEVFDGRGHFVEGAFPGWVFLIAGIGGMFMIFLVGPIRTLVIKNETAELEQDVEAGNKLMNAVIRGRIDEARATGEAARRAV